MPRPHAKGSSGNAAASATSAASPTLVSSAEDTHTRQTALLGDPQRPTDPTQRQALDDRDVGGFGPSHVQRVVGSADGLIGGDPHIDTPTHLRQFIDGAARLLDVLQPARRTVEHADMTHSGVDVPRRVGVHADRALLAERVTHGLNQIWSSANEPGWSATLTLAVRQPERFTMSWAVFGSTAGTVQLMGMRVRTGVGQAPVHCSSAAANHGTEAASP